jgi:hypothetical protein
MKGYLCIAQNTTTNYLQMAYLQALSCKLTQSKVNSFSVLVDKATAEQVTDQHRQVFDNVIVLQQDLSAGTDVKQLNECQVFAYSPYKQTIKTEADMLFTSDYSWIWNIYHQYDIMFTQTVYTYDHHIITNRSQRRLFDENLLPNIYSAWCYFSYDLKCKRFYDTMRTIAADWDHYRDIHLKNCRYITPRTDELYALAAQAIDIMTPDLGFGFVHMKNQLQGLDNTPAWHKQLTTEIQLDFSPVIGYHKQYRPLHYQDKSFVDQEIIDRYEHGYRARMVG